MYIGGIFSFKTGMYPECRLYREIKKKILKILVHQIWDISVLLVLRGWGIDRLLNMHLQYYDVNAQVSLWGL